MHTLHSRLTAHVYISHHAKPLRIYIRVDFCDDDIIECAAVAVEGTTLAIRGGTRQLRNEQLKGCVPLIKRRNQA